MARPFPVCLYDVSVNNTLTLVAVAPVRYSVYVEEDGPNYVSKNDTRLEGSNCTQNFVSLALESN